MTLRRLVCWKSVFYRVLLPTLRRFGPGVTDAALGFLGRVAGAMRPSRRRVLRRGAELAAESLGSRVIPDRVAFRTALAASVPRYLARDYLLEGLGDEEFDQRFDVTGFEPVAARLAAGEGVVLVGSHLGAHLAAMHWMVRRGLPVRLLVQRPRHVSPTLDRFFDRPDTRDPQSAYLLRRDLSRSEAAARVLRARNALRAGRAVYLNGDIPWRTSGAHTGRLLGIEHPFLALWAELAILANVPVVRVFCTHLPAGRYALSFDPPERVEPGNQGMAVASYLARLAEVVAANPAEAIPYLTWPAYLPPLSITSPQGASLPGDYALSRSPVAQPAL